MNSNQDNRDTAIKAVVLGASGFIGGALTRKFASAGYDVVGLSSSDVDLRDASESQTIAKLIDANTVLIMAAAITRDREDSLEAFTANMQMVTNVAQLVRERPPGQLVYLSTTAVYGNVGGHPISEKNPVDPDSYYAIAKYAGERVLQQATASAEIPSLIVRPASVYGPGDTHTNYGPATFFRSARATKSIRLFSSGEDRRDHMYVDDLAELTERLVSGHESGVYNLVTGQSHSFKEIVAVLRHTLPFKLTVTEVPRQLPLLHQSYDVAKLRGVAPDYCFVELEEGLRRTWQAINRPLAEV